MKLGNIYSSKKIVKTLRSNYTGITNGNFVFKDKTALEKSLGVLRICAGVRCKPTRLLLPLLLHGLQV